MIKAGIIAVKWKHLVSSFSIFLNESKVEGEAVIRDCFHAAPPHKGFSYKILNLQQVVHKVSWLCQEQYRLEGSGFVTSWLLSESVDDRILPDPS